MRNRGSEKSRVFAGRFIFLRADHLFKCSYLNTQKKSVSLNIIVTMAKRWSWGCGSKRNLGKVEQSP